jgi:hypothetical protein
VVVAARSRNGRLVQKDQAAAVHVRIWLDLPVPLAGDQVGEPAGKGKACQVGGGLAGLPGRVTLTVSGGVGPRIPADGDANGGGELGGVTGSSRAAARMKARHTSAPAVTMSALRRKPVLRPYRSQSAGCRSI